MTLDKRGGVIMCSMYGWESCSGNSLTDNIVAGAYYAGFVTPGITCGSGDEETFYNNVAHSVVGVGAAVYPNPSVSDHISCLQASYFSAYKNSMNGIWSFFETEQLIYSNMILADNVEGIAMII